MNRKIEFRIWDGTYMYYPHDNIQIVLEFNKISGWNVRPNINGRNVKYLAGESAGNKNKVFKMLQFVGLEDKNRRKIYEGDIVRKPNDFWIGGESVGDSKGTFVDDVFVEYVDGSFRLNKIGNDSNNYYGVINHSKNTYSNVLEIIGNIYENPELLKTE